MQPAVSVKTAKSKISAMDDVTKETNENVVPDSLREGKKCISVKEIVSGKGRGKRMAFL